METPEVNAQPEGKQKKEKKPVVPNECSIWRWILTIVFMIIFGGLFGGVSQVLSKVLAGVIAPENYELTEGLLLFAGLYWGFVLALKLFAKTSVHDFVFGFGGRFDKKEAKTVALLTVCGLVAASFITIKTITLNPTMTFTRFLYIFAAIALFLWMQTSWEEFVFRGLFIRIFHKNNVGVGVKSVIIGIVSSVIFMSVHLVNPEVTSQSGIDIFLAAMTYVLSGFIMYYCDLHFKNLMPGMVLHLVNNAFCFLILSTPNSLMGGTTIFFDNAPTTGLVAFVSEVIMIIPFVIYFIVSSKKQKQE